MAREFATKRMFNGAPRPTHQAIYGELRERILFGDFEPGGSVTLQGVADELGVSLTPVREAVRRLIAGGALQFHDNRRISLPAMTEPLLEEIYAVRAVTEPELARRAADHATREDVERLVTLDFALDEAIAKGDVKGYLRANYDFHFGLYGLSDSRVFLPIVENLWLQFGPCLRVACHRFGTSGFSDQHKQAIAALRSGDAEAARHAVAEDIEQGHLFVLDDLRRDGGVAD
ncbi:MAG TPA: GntR family transcriptional regulator [Devosiaceae bacterium]